MEEELMTKGKYPENFEVDTEKLKEEIRNKFNQFYKVEVRKLNCSPLYKPREVILISLYYTRYECFEIIWDSFNYYQEEFERFPPIYEVSEFVSEILEENVFWMSTSLGKFIENLVETYKCEKISTFNWHLFACETDREGYNLWGTDTVTFCGEGMIRLKDKTGSDIIVDFKSESIMHIS